MNKLHTYLLRHMKPQLVDSYKVSLNTEQLTVEQLNHSNNEEATHSGHLNCICIY